MREDGNARRGESERMRERESENPRERQEDEIARGREDDQRTRMWEGENARGPESERTRIREDQRTRNPRERHEDDNALNMRMVNTRFNVNGEFVVNHTRILVTPIATYTEYFSNQQPDGPWSVPNALLRRGCACLVGLPFRRLNKRQRNWVVCQSTHSTYIDISCVFFLHLLVMLGEEGRAICRDGAYSIPNHLCGAL